MQESREVNEYHLWEMPSSILRAIKSAVFRYCFYDSMPLTKSPATNISRYSGQVGIVPLLINLANVEYSRETFKFHIYVARVACSFN